MNQLQDVFLVSNLGFTSLFQHLTAYVEAKMGWISPRDGFKSGFA